MFIQVPVTTEVIEKMPTFIQPEKLKTIRSSLRSIRANAIITSCSIAGAEEPGRDLVAPATRGEQLDDLVVGECDDEHRHPHGQRQIGG
jgi:hypothetical protein